MEEFLKKALGLREKIVADVPQLQRGMVWCKECGHSLKVDSAKCLKEGWPKCCGETMSIDSPTEREEFEDE